MPCIQGTGGIIRVQCATIEHRSAARVTTELGAIRDASSTVTSAVITPQHRRTITVRHRIADTAIESDTAPLLVPPSQWQSREVFGCVRIARNLFTVY